MALKQGGFGGVQPPSFAHKMIRIAPPDCKHGILLEYDRKYAWAWVLWSPYVLGTRTGLCSGHGCPGHCMLLAQERKYVLVMDALVAVCSWKAQGNYALGMDALVTV